MKSVWEHLETYNLPMLIFITIIGVGQSKSNSKKVKLYLRYNGEGKCGGGKQKSNLS